MGAEGRGKNKLRENEKRLQDAQIERIQRYWSDPEYRRQQDSLCDAFGVQRLSKISYPPYLKLVRADD
ncbi:MAG: hypothetical protein KKD18_04360 [Nanoarchaeota archaeon]|nr:hypothetical protein [Nanoarchaeota archaeon]MBU0977624.1 hypothetical protein [Nanoarchaeota archaeon]